MRSPSQYVACNALYGWRLKDASRNVSVVAAIKRSDVAAMLCCYDLRSCCYSGFQGVCSAGWTSDSLRAELPSMPGSLAGGENWVHAHKHFM